jgi:hypothetical protein
MGAAGEGRDLVHPRRRQPAPRRLRLPLGARLRQRRALNPFGGICERQPLGLNDRAEDKSAAGRRSTRRKSTSQQ